MVPRSVIPRLDRGTSRGTGGAGSDPPDKPGDDGGERAVAVHLRNSGGVGYRHPRDPGEHAVAVRLRNHGHRFTAYRTMNDMPHRAIPPADGPPEPDRARPNRPGVFGVLDIGTTKIACLIGRTRGRRRGSLRVLGFATGSAGSAVCAAAPSPTWIKAERAIRACVGQAEDMADTRLRPV